MVSSSRSSSFIIVVRLVALVFVVVVVYLIPLPFTLHSCVAIFCCLSHTRTQRVCTFWRRLTSHCCCFCLFFAQWRTHLNTRFSTFMHNPHTHAHTHIRNVNSFPRFVVVFFSRGFSIRFARIANCPSHDLRFLLLAIVGSILLLNLLLSGENRLNSKSNF